MIVPAPSLVYKSLLREWQRWSIFLFFVNFNCLSLQRLQFFFFFFFFFFFLGGILFCDLCNNNSLSKLNHARNEIYFCCLSMLFWKFIGHATFHHQRQDTEINKFTFKWKLKRQGQVRVTSEASFFSFISFFFSCTQTSRIDSKLYRVLPV